MEENKNLPEENLDAKNVNETAQENNQTDVDETKVKEAEQRKTAVQTPKKDKKQKKVKKENKLAKRTKETFNELKKVSWPSFGEVVKKTGVVLVVVLIFLIVIFGFDYVLNLLFKLLTGTNG